MTTKQAAALLGITQRAVASLIRAEVIKAERHGRDYWIEPAEVERYQRERRPRGNPNLTKRTDGRAT